jgi:hypothetical protein
LKIASTGFVKIKKVKTKMNELEEIGNVFKSDPVVLIHDWDEMTPLRTDEDLYLSAESEEISISRDAECKRFFDEREDVDIETMDPLAEELLPKKKTKFRRSSYGGYVGPEDLVDNQDIPKPSQKGTYFKLVSDIASRQQIERIAICPPDQYPLLKIRKRPDLRKKPKDWPDDVPWAPAHWPADKPWPPQEPHCIGVDYFTVGLQQNFQLRVLILGWSHHSEFQECKFKTPALLSTHLDREEGYDLVKVPEDDRTGFLFRIRIFTFNKAGGMDILDDVTTAQFRTVSHSKQTIFKRRPGRPTNKQRRRKNPVDSLDSEDDIPSRRGRSRRVKSQVVE